MDEDDSLFDDDDEDLGYDLTDAFEDLDKPQNLSTTETQ